MSVRSPRPVGVQHGVPAVRGDAVSGAGLDAALDGIDVAYFLIHSMEGSAGDFDARERAAAENFVAAAQAAGLRRVVYLGGLVPDRGPASTHLSSRLTVEHALLGGAPEAVALRASIVVGARSRSFRFLVRLVERMRVLALPAWRDYRTRPIDARDVTAFLLSAATTSHATGGLSLGHRRARRPHLRRDDRAHRRQHAVGRPAVRLGVDATPIAAPVAARIAGEDLGLIGPLMQSLSGDLLPPTIGRRTYWAYACTPSTAPVERALRDWEETEKLAAGRQWT